MNISVINHKVIPNNLNGVQEITVKMKDLDSGEVSTYGIDQSDWGITDPNTITNELIQAHCNLAQTAFEEFLTNKSQPTSVNEDVQPIETVFE